MIKIYINRVYINPRKPGIKLSKVSCKTKTLSPLPIEIGVVITTKAGIKPPTIMKAAKEAKTEEAEKPAEDAPAADASVEAKPEA